MTNKDFIPSVNFHLWEPCNMRCKFCFATFKEVKQKILPKGHLPEKDAINVVAELAKYGYKKITFAGGEPLLCPWLPKLIKKAKEFGLTTMIVTNGSVLTEKFLLENRLYLDWVTLSVDSLTDKTNLKTGRAITGKKIITEKKYMDLIDLIKKNGFGFKINTVITALNYLEDFNQFISFVEPSRWKVFQVLPITGENDNEISSLRITEKQFRVFLENHKNQKNMIPECNNTMKGSYAMIDPAGRFFDNSEGKYNYTESIINKPIDTLLKTMNYNKEKFLDRNGIYNW
ncbi:viperin family antiviral radical SAM protein [Tenacibaculum sp. FZY0031]|uniref:viperin family antiviral radical SAM protein n=1 Tax=Tenacibaculum sp. FZY0031 TaxID=3116648 RepID=UPI002EB8F3D9|nr:viperin family antiviral radical SAM protein [Tenacibaculum sp. FZY0031]